MAKGLIGVIGGSGLYQMEGVEISSEKWIDTPFGKPSDAIMLGSLNGFDLAFLPRHGRGHRLLPHEINYRANIFALKSIGVETIISVSAVGSMKEGIRPGHLVIVDQFVDRTKNRRDTFFGNGIAAHVSFAEPVCPRLRKAAIQAVKHVTAEFHEKGTYICIEGPMFSSRADSMIYRSWGADIIGMTNATEARLVREAEICFVTIALSTDYDCWHVGEGPVDVAMVVRIMQENIAKAQATVRLMLPEIDTGHDCSCHHALDGAIMTYRSEIPEDAKQRLMPIISKYV